MAANPPAQEVALVMVKATTAVAPDPDTAMEALVPGQPRAVPVGVGKMLPQVELKDMAPEALVLTTV